MTYTDWTMHMMDEYVMPTALWLSVGWVSLIVMVFLYRITYDAWKGHR